MNTTDIRQAILMAADKIERFPGQFDFGETRVPSAPTDCGCALGWFGYFAGTEKDLVVSFVSEGLLGVTDNVFYGRMHSMERPGEAWPAFGADCAACLRRYADTYHPAEPEQHWITSYLRRLSVAGESGQYVGGVA